MSNPEQPMRNRGIVCHLPSEKRYGFIRPEEKMGEGDLFFHMRDYNGVWAGLATNDTVEFDLLLDRDKIKATNVSLVSRAAPLPDNVRQAVGMGHRRSRPVRILGPYTGPTLGLTAEQRRSALADISRWKLEARLDDIRRYFYAVPELNDITTGDAAYVIGRKGTGKTALVQYLASETHTGILVAKLSFKHFPFNELYSHANSSYTRPNQYITLWKLIIYSAVCRLIAQCRSTDPLIRKTIEKAFPPTEADRLGSVVGKWITGDLGLTVMGTGVNAARWFKDKKPSSLQEKVDNLELFIKKHASADKLLVLFDELDEDYKEMFENYRRSDYLDLLTSLFKATQDVRATFAGHRVCLYPVVFLRDDIYDLIQDPDKNKWKDLRVDLDWTDEGIKGLLAHRLSRVMGVEEEPLEVLWYSVFSKDPLVYSSGHKEIDSFSYMKMSAQGRPRDYINYLQECASIELKRSAYEISTDTVREADKAYSNYLKRELVDEIHGIIPDVEKVFDIFAESRKWIISIDEFKSAYQERVAAGNVQIADVDMILKTLFYFSVIGNVARIDTHIFRHERREAQLNFKEQIVVHRGLMKSLQIL